MFLAYLSLLDPELMNQVIHFYLAQYREPQFHDFQQINKMFQGKREEGDFSQKGKKRREEDNLT